MRTTILPLTIKQKWFFLILDGIKKEEYREVKPYYDSRVLNRLREYGDPDTVKTMLRQRTLDFGLISLRNGYSRQSPELVAECGIRIGEGKEEWGAEPGKEYYIFEIRYIRWSSLKQGAGYGYAGTSVPERKGEWQDGNDI